MRRTMMTRTLLSFAWKRRDAGKIGTTLTMPFINPKSILRAAVLVASTFLLQVPVMAQSTKLETEIIEFSYHGFSPRKIVRKPGAFMLSVNNITKNALIFELVPATQALIPTNTVGTPPPLKSISLDHTTGSIKSRQMLTLAPGTYTLRINGKTGPTIDIVISPTGQ